MTTKHEQDSAKHRSRRTVIAGLCVAWAVAACGGGDSTRSAAALPSASADTVRSADAGAAAGSQSVAAADVGVVVARGPITALGSLGVNNIRYDDRAASVSINHQARQLADLRLGMVAEVQVERSAGGALSVARSISVSSFAEGSVEAIDPVARTIRVAGILISVPAEAVFEGLRGLQDPSFRIGDFVEVHGLAGGVAGATATRVERKNAGAAATEDRALTGAIIGIDTVRQTFVVAGTTVAYSRARIENVGAGLAVGMTVRVEGIPGGPNVLTATEINGAQRAATSLEGFRVEETGYVSDFAGPASFKVNGLSVNATGAAITGSIADNVRVDVRGVLRNGVLVASTVARSEASDGTAGGEKSTVAGVVAAVGAQTFEMNGLTVLWNGDTRFDGVAAGALRTGMRLEVDAIWSGAEYVATRIKAMN